MSVPSINVDVNSNNVSNVNLKSKFLHFTIYSKLIEIFIFHDKSNIQKTKSEFVHQNYKYDYIKAKSVKCIFLCLLQHLLKTTFLIEQMRP